MVLRMQFVPYIITSLMVLRMQFDRMSYEELLELGDRIGYVDTGLREEEITRRITKMKLSTLDAMPRHFSTEMEKKCSIC